MGRVYNGNDDSKDQEQENQREVCKFCFTEKSEQHVQKIKSNGFLLKKRVSPRLQTIPIEKRPYYGSVQRAQRGSNVCKDLDCSRITKDDNQNREPDSVKYIAGTDEVKIDVTSNEKLIEHALKARKTTSLSPKQVGVGCMDLLKARTEGLILGRRVSPRVQKRPYYGSVNRRRRRRRTQSYISKDIGSRETEGDNQNAHLDSAEDNTGIHEAKVNVTSKRQFTQHTLKLRTHGLVLERRVSPRLKAIPADKMPHYDCTQRRKSRASRYHECEKETKQNDFKSQLDSCKDDSYRGRTPDGITKENNTVNQLQKIRSDGCLLKQTVIPQLENVIANKTQLKNDQQMGLCSPDDNVSVQKNKVDHRTEESNLNICRKDAKDRSTDSVTTLGFVPVEDDDTTIIKLEPGTYLECRSGESSLDDEMDEMSCALAQEIVVGLMAVSPLLLKCKGRIDSGEKTGEEETGNEDFDVTMRDKFLQQDQQIESKVPLFKRRVSPRLKDIPKDKRPYYGNKRLRKLNATKEYICKRSDPQKPLCSLKDTTEKKVKLHCLMQECVTISAWKDREDGDNDSRVTPGFGTMKNKKAEPANLENGVYLKALDYNSFLSDHICERADARLKETVKELSKHYPYLDKALLEEETVSIKSSTLPGLVCEDLSHGEEDIPIPVTNMIDPPIAPAGFKYTNTIEVARNVSIPPSPPGCKCKGSCTNPKSCSCARLNGSDFPYVRIDGGRLIEPKDVVFECGPGCGCGPNCINRISQRKLKYRLEVYRTKNKGWAVRSWDLIPSGAPVCEYIGVIRRSADLENVSENEFIFEIDCWHTMNGIGSREPRQGDVPAHARSLVEKKDEAENDTEFCIDGGSSGNVTRFINHSCDPNLFVQCVLSSHYDIRLARIVLFAADDIPPMQELTYDYGFELDSVIGPDGKVKKLPCYCYTSECRGRLY